MKTLLFFAFYYVLCATFLFKICSCATVPKETVLKLKHFHAEENKAFGNGALTGEGDNPVKGDNNDDDEDEGEWAEEEENEGEEDFEDFGDDDEHADGENNEYDDDEDRLMDEEYAIEDEEDADDPKQLTNVSDDDDDDDDSPEETAITEKTLELENADRKGILTPLQFEIIE